MKVLACDGIHEDGLILFRDDGTVVMTQGQINGIRGKSVRVEVTSNAADVKAQINSIQGNRRWAQARKAVWRSKLLDISEFESPVSMHGSDSQTLDNALEWLLLGGMDMLHWAGLAGVLAAMAMSALATRFARRQGLAA